MYSKKVIIEGNVSSGKSTLINYLKSKLEDCYILDSGFGLFHPNLDYNIINYNNENPKEWTFLTQLTFMKLLEKLQNQEQNHSISIFNRSIHSVHHVFNKVYRNEKYMSYEEYKYLYLLYEKLKQRETTIDLLIYFRSDPKVLETRATNNKFKQYIKKFQIYYDTLIDIFKLNTKIKKIYIIDSNKKKEELTSDYDEILKILLT